MSRKNPVPGVYAAIDLGTGKVYVGSSVDVPTRVSRHRHQLRYGVHPNAALQAAWDRCGGRSLLFKVLERCGESEVKTREQYWMDTLLSYAPGFGYNACPFADGSGHSEETRRKMSAAMTGRRASPETRAKIGAYHRGKTIPPEQRALASAALRGRKHSAETKAKIGAAHRGKTQPPGAVAATAARLRGRKLSEAVREKMRQSQLRRYQDPLLREIKARHLRSLLRGDDGRVLPRGGGVGK